MQEMKLQDLKSKSPTELLSFAEEVAVENVKRFVRPPDGGLERYDWLADGAQSPYLIGEFVEIKTVWHPIGA